MRSRPRLRSLGEPAPLRLRTDEEGCPVFVRLGGRRLRVASVRSTWRIDDEWWRRLISRRYFALVLEDGRLLTVYQDLRSRAWFAQPGG